MGNESIARNFNYLSHRDSTAGETAVLSAVRDCGARAIRLQGRLTAVDTVLFQLKKIEESLEAGQGSISTDRQQDLLVLTEVVGLFEKNQIRKGKKLLQGRFGAVFVHEKPEDPAYVIDFAKGVKMEKPIKRGMLISLLGKLKVYRYSQNDQWKAEYQGVLDECSLMNNNPDHLPKNLNQLINICVWLLSRASGKSKDEIH